MALVCLVLAFVPALFAQAVPTNAVRIVSFEGKVEVLHAGRPVWDAATTNQVLLAGDRVRTGERGRALIRLSDLTFYRMSKLTVVEVRAQEKKKPIFDLLKGIIYFFHRDEPREFPVQTPTGVAIVLGTEFNLEVAEDGATTLHLIDGTVELTNQLGRVELVTGEAGAVRPGQAPARTASIETVNVIQWCLYYPGVLDPAELDFTEEEKTVLGDSLIAYESGDLLGALESYPNNRRPGSGAETVYLAGLLLSVGQVKEAEQLLTNLDAANPSQPLVRALRTVVASVKQLPMPESGSTESASVWLAQSYYYQSRFDLNKALTAVRRAVALSPGFGFAWARLAEVEFIFGRTGRAGRALEQSLALAPRNAQAVALGGFLAAAENRWDRAMDRFDQAIELDSALGNAWLGRGLCRIRLGDAELGREDLQAAATLEPRRALFRSDLGRAFYHAGDGQRALREIDLAKRFDPNDPTAWLYSALLLREENRINQAARDLEESQRKNGNRRLYRPRQGLSADRAMRGVNLALIYDDLGMEELSAREAGRAVEADPSNFASHLFLANSYQNLRDPKGVSQRFETAAVSEYLLADLLGPVGAGTLAQSTSPHEHSRLFDTDGAGLVSTTEYFSNGGWLQSGAQYGNYGDFAYAVSGFYRFDNGQRANNESEQRELSVQLKYEITPRDRIYFRAIHGHFQGGDLRQLYNPADAIAGLEFEETQEPIGLFGYVHDWGPGIRTLFLASGVNDRFTAANPRQATLFLQRDPVGGAVTNAFPISIEQAYANELNLYSVEVQQLWEHERHSLSVGGRYQRGEFETSNQHSNPTRTNASFIPFLFPTDPERADAHLQRLSLYGYYRWRLAEPVQLIAGVSYDRLTFPLNFRYAPLSDEEETDDQVSPKGGLIWTPTDTTTVRGGYSRSLGGVSFDQSFRLEPTQIAGFNQAFRSLIPESVAGANAAAEFETWSASLEQEFGTGTYVALQGEWLQSRVDRLLGAYSFVPFAVTRTGTPERLDYDERSLLFTINQLIGQEWAFGARYRLSEAELRSEFGEIPVTAEIATRSEIRSVLHQVNLFGIYQHRSGFFSRLESLWNAQSNHGYAQDQPGDEFWQFNALAGYRFARRRAVVTAGVLNIADQDYRLSPLNLTPELPRDRTATVSLRLSF